MAAGARWQSVGHLALAGAVVGGATLSFGMEPLVGRLLMPGFGASVHVWLTCLMLFQGLLFLGYAYAHFIAPRIGVAHLGLLLLPLLMRPLDIPEAPIDRPTISAVLGALVSFAGPGFIMLSTTAVVAQSWWTASRVKEDDEPYPLYALSNLGSLVALLGYPLLIEPCLDLGVQRGLWVAGYLAYVALMTLAWRRLRPTRGPIVDEPSAKAPLSSWGTRAYWLGASAFPAAFLVATTNLIASELGSVPLIWVLPLSLYLASFILTFRGNTSVLTWFGRITPELVVVGAFAYALPVLGWAEALLFLVVLFGLATLVHGRLYARRPPPEELSHFYLWIAFGGWLGGAAISLGAPLLFNSVLEYPIVLVALGLLAIASRTRVARSRSPWLLLVRVTVIVGLGGAVLLRSSMAIQHPPVARHRSFYGTYQVRDLDRVEGAPDGLRVLVHGATIHGAQLLAPEDRRTPVYYFHEGGGIQSAYAQVASPRRIAVLGLGVGAVAAYAKRHDRIDFIELDPDNERLAREYFTFLDDSPAEIHVDVGDGRIVLAEGGPSFDLIHMDAFSGDGIPVHLLTLEAIRIYLSRLRTDGLLLFHISSRSHDLRPVLEAAAGELGLYGVFNEPPTASSLPAIDKPSRCVVMTRTPSRLDGLVAQGWRRFGPEDGISRIPAWTDARVNILSTLRWSR